MQKDARIPTLVGLILLLIGLGGGIFLVESRSSLSSQAEGAKNPKSVVFSNVTDTSFSVSWYTDVPVSGLINFQEKGLITAAQIAADARDQTGTLATSRLTHFISVSGLKANTGYDITIISGGKEYTHKDYQVKTTSPIAYPPQYRLDPAYGNLTDKQSQSVSDALVYLSFPNSQVLATFTDQSGSWTIPLALIRNSDGNSYFQPNPNDKEQIIFNFGSSQSMVATNIDNDSPLPSVKLGQHYDFTKKSWYTKPGLIIAQNNFSGVIKGVVNTAFKIIAPINNAVIPFSKPEISGTGTPGKNVILTITGPITTAERLLISNTGNWNWTPKTPLPAGKYLATAVTSNNPSVLSVSFDVLKSGTSVLAAATPSATLKPSPSTSPRLSPSPSAAIKSTPSATLKPRVSPAVSASPSSKPPVSGNWQPTLALLIVGLGIVLLGILNFRKQF